MSEVRSSMSENGGWTVRLWTRRTDYSHGEEGKGRTDRLTRRGKGTDRLTRRRWSRGGRWVEFEQIADSWLFSPVLVRSLRLTPPRTRPPSSSSARRPASASAP
jgi:hypothetical protein